MSDLKREVISPVVIGGRQLLLIQQGTNGTATFHLGDQSQVDFLGNPIVQEVLVDTRVHEAKENAETLVDFSRDKIPSADELLQVLGRAMKEAVQRREAAKDRVRGGEVGDV